jgi:hypothetical protein
MILSIPYQALEVGNIHLTLFQTDKYGKSIARLSYKDNSIDFQDVSILTPPLRIIDYNPESSRLRLDLSDQHLFQVKFNMLQEYLISTFYIHQQSFLGFSKEMHETIRDHFHFLLNDNVLSLYIFPTTLVKKSDGTTCKVSDLQSGDTIRSIIRLQGVSQIWNNRDNYFRLRLQHSIPAIWFLG